MSLSMSLRKGKQEMSPLSGKNSGQGIWLISEMTGLRLPLFLDALRKVTRSGWNLRYEKNYKGQRAIRVFLEKGTLNNNLSRKASRDNKLEAERVLF